MKKLNPWIYWAPRFLSILFIIFLAMFSLDVFDEHLGFWGTVIGLLMHNIPSLILIIFLTFAWKYELVGAIGYGLAGFAYIVDIVFFRNFQLFMISWIIFIAGPAFVIAFLFYLNWKKKNNFFK